MEKEIKDSVKEEMGCVIVSICLLGCINRLPQIFHLKTAEIYSLTALESRSPKLKCWQVHASPKPAQENPSWPLLPSGVPGMLGVP